MLAKKAQARLKTELEPVRHPWPGIEGDPVRLGVNSLGELRDRDPEELFKAYCAQAGQDYDLCVRDTFTSLVAFAKPANRAPGGASRASVLFRSMPSERTIIVAKARHTSGR